MDGDISQQEAQEGPGDGPVADGFWSLWTREQRRLERLCVAMLRSADDAEDALHNAMLRAAPRFHSGIRSPGPWLSAVTRNVCIEMLRRRNSAQLQYGLEERETPCPDTGQEDQLLQDEELQELRQSIEKLPERMRDATRLRILDGLSYREIGMRLNISEANARKRNQFARRQLQVALKDGAELDAIAVAMRRARSKSVSQTIRTLQVREISFEAQSSIRLLQLSDGGGQTEFSYFGPRSSLRSGQRIPSLQRYIERYPGGWRKRMELAWAQAMTGGMSQAIEDLEGLCSRHEGLTAAATLRGDFQLLLGDRRGAARSFRNALSVAREECAKLLLRGMLHEVEGRPRAAIAALEQAARSAAGYPEALRRALYCALRLSDQREALRLAAALQTYSRRDLAGLSSLAMLLWRENRSGEALRHADTALVIDRRDVQALYVSAQVRTARGQVRGQEGAVTRTILRRLECAAPNSRLAILARVAFWRNRGRLSRVALSLQQLSQKHGADPIAREVLAWHDLRRGDTQQAALHIQSALATQYAERSTLDLAAEIALAVRHAPLCQALCEKMVRAGGALSAARVLAARGAREARVRELLQVASGQGPADAWQELNLAAVHLSLGEPRRALNYAEGAIALLHPEESRTRYLRAASVAHEAAELLELPKQARAWRRRMADWQTDRSA